MNRFNHLNTEGYSQDGLDALNEEWADLAEEMGLEEFTGEYDEAYQQFCDEVGQRLESPEQRRAQRRLP